MSRSINYNQLTGDVEDIEILLEDKEIPKMKKIKSKKKKFDDGTSVKQDGKRNKPSRFRKKD
jgi:hypothetical protein